MEKQSESSASAGPSAARGPAIQDSRRTIVRWSLALGLFIASAFGFAWLPMFDSGSKNYSLSEKTARSHEMKETDARRQKVLIEALQSPSGDRESANIRRALAFVSQCQSTGQNR